MTCTTRLTKGQREYDLEVARVNIIGELMDLQAGEFLEEDVDSVAIGNALAERYRELWQALTEVESFGYGERWRVQARIDRLNDLGFDVGELDITSDLDGTSVRIQPKVVESGHHSRRLMRLTGLDVGENQARRLLNDLDEYRAATDRQAEDESFVAHDWLTEVFEPAVRSIPRELRGKLEPAQIFHELLDHRWFLSQQQHRDVPLNEVAKSYAKHILPNRPDEQVDLRHPAGRPARPDRHDPGGRRRPAHRLTARPDRLGTGCPACCATAVQPCPALPCPAALHCTALHEEPSPHVRRGGGRPRTGRCPRRRPR